MGVFVEKYCASTDKLMVLLQRALEAGDYPEVRLHSHSIKGAAASIGVEVMRASVEDGGVGAAGGGTSRASRPFQRSGAGPR